MADEKDDPINSLISQLRTASEASNELSSQSAAMPDINRDNIEEFVMQTSAHLVNKSLETMQMYQEMINTAPNADDVDAYSNLVGATTKAIDGLNKLVIQDKRSKSSKDIKNLELAGKKELQATQAISDAYVASREEMFKKLMDETEIIKVIDVSDTSTACLSSDP